MLDKTCKDTKNATSLSSLLVICNTWDEHVILLQDSKYWAGYLVLDIQNQQDVTHLFYTFCDLTFACIKG